MRIDVEFIKKSSQVYERQNIEYSNDNLRVEMIWNNERLMVNVDDIDEDKCIDELYLIWELCALYDGYFYRPTSYFADGNNIDINALYRVELYRSSDTQVATAVSLGRNKMIISNDVIRKYDSFRNCDFKQKKLNKTFVNALFYLYSKKYEEVLIDHRLSLLLNICDGFVINTIKDGLGTTKNIAIILDELNNRDLFMEGLKICGITDNSMSEVLVNVRNSLDHYVYSDKYVGTFIKNGKTDNGIYLYLYYVMELALRNSIFKYLGINIDSVIIADALKNTVDWAKAHYWKEGEPDPVFYFPVNQMNWEIRKIDTDRQNYEGEAVDSTAYPRLRLEEPAVT